MPFPDYAELHCLSNFSFLRGASHPEEMVMRANGVPTFKVKLGSHRGNLALQVLEPVKSHR